jgi:hypothetical protein
MADDREQEARAFARWPLLLAAVVAITVSVGLNLADQPSYAIASVLLGLGSAAFGAFLYAEGARHRDWLSSEQKQEPPQEDQP